MRMNFVARAYFSACPPRGSARRSDRDSEWFCTEGRMSLAVSRRLLPATLAAVLAGALSVGAGAVAADASTVPDTPRPGSWATTAAAVDPALAGLHGPAQVIVTEDGSQPGSPGARAVASLGGHVRQPLPLISGFAATVPAE